LSQSNTRLAVALQRLPAVLRFLGLFDYRADWGFAEALNGQKHRRREIHFKKQYLEMFFPFRPFQPLSTMHYLGLNLGRLKKGNVDCTVSFSFHRFLSDNSIRTKPMMTAMSMALPMLKTYISVIGAGVGVGSGLAAGASFTPMAVSA
jgi:hypothetical protein